MVATPKIEGGGDEPVHDGVKAEASGIPAELTVAGAGAALHAKVPEEAHA